MDGYEVFPSSEVLAKFSSPGEGGSGSRGTGGRGGERDTGTMVDGDADWDWPFVPWVRRVETRSFLELSDPERNSDSSRHIGGSCYDGPDGTTDLEGEAHD